MKYSKVFQPNLIKQRLGRLFLNLLTSGSVSVLLIDLKYNFHGAIKLVKAYYVFTIYYLFLINIISRGLLAADVSEILKLENSLVVSAVYIFQYKKGLLAYKKLDTRI